MLSGGWSNPTSMTSNPLWRYLPEVPGVGALVGRGESRATGERREQHSRPQPSPGHDAELHGEHGDERQAAAATALTRRSRVGTCLAVSARKASRKSPASVSMASRIAPTSNTVPTSAP